MSNQHVPNSPSSGTVTFQNAQDAQEWVENLNRLYPAFPYGTSATVTSTPNGAVVVRYFVGTSD